MDRAHQARWPDGHRRPALAQSPWPRPLLPGQGKATVRDPCQVCLGGQPPPHDAPLGQGPSPNPPCARPLRRKRSSQLAEPMANALVPSQRPQAAQALLVLCGWREGRYLQALPCSAVSFSAMVNSVTRSKTQRGSMSPRSVACGGSRARVSRASSSRRASGLRHPQRWLSAPFPPAGPPAPARARGQPFPSRSLRLAHALTCPSHRLPIPPSSHTCSTAGLAGSW